MFTLTITRNFTFEVRNGGIYLKAGRRELFWSRAEGLIRS